MPLHRDSITTIDEYINYLNNYFRECPLSLRKTLLEKEIPFLDAQIDQHKGSKHHEYHSQLFYLHLKRQARQHPEDNKFDSLANKINANQLQAIGIDIKETIASAKNNDLSDSKCVDNAFENILTSLYWASFYQTIKDTLSRKVKKDPYVPITLDDIQKLAWAAFVNLYIEETAIQQLDATLIIQMADSLPWKIYPDEVGALQEILRDYHNITPHLTPLSQLRFALTTDRELIHTRSLVSTAIINDTLKDIQLDELIEYYRILTSDDYSEMPPELIKTIFDQNPNVDLDSLERIPKPYDEKDIKAALKDFFYDRRVPVSQAEKQDKDDEKDSYLYLKSTPCNASKDGYLTRDYGSPRKGAEEESPTYIYENMDDIQGYLSKALDGTNHRYLPITDFMASIRPNCIRADTFLIDRLNELNKIKPFIGQANHPLLSSIQKVNQDTDTPSQIETSLDEIVSPYIIVLESSINQKISTSDKENIQERLKSIKTLQHFIENKIAYMAYLDSLVVYHIEMLPKTTVFDASEQEAIRALTLSKSLADELSNYRTLLRQKASDSHDVSLKGHIKGAIAHIDAIESLLNDKNNCAFDTINTAYLMLDNVENHQPSLVERGFITTLRDFFLFIFKAAFKKADFATENSLLFREDERVVMKARKALGAQKSIYNTRHTFFAAPIDEANPSAIPRTSLTT